MFIEVIIFMLCLAFVLHGETASYRPFFTINYPLEQRKLDTYSFTASEISILIFTTFDSGVELLKFRIV